MARLNVFKMEKLEKERNNVQDEVVSTYSTFIKDDKRYFQIDMYGSNERVFAGKVSQVIQLDKENAIELISVLKHVFNLDKV